MDILGVPIQVWHGLVVEVHSGVVILMILSLAVMVLRDVLSRGKSPSAQTLAIRQGVDFVTYVGSFVVVIFLLLSGITGYLIQPYSTIIASPLLINKALSALGALYFWAVFLFTRYWCGSEVWRRRWTYATQVVAAACGFLFTTISGSIGAELSFGQSVLEPVYQYMDFSWRTFLIQPFIVEATAALLAVGVLVILLMPSRRR